jgi:hypothetical protein
LIIEGIATMLPAHPINEAILGSKIACDRADDSPRGLVMVIGGVGGLDWCGIALRHLLKNRRPTYAIQVFPWGLGFARWHADLTNIINRDAKARLIAETIGLYKASQPGCPVFVVAKSGGAGVAVKALELLDEAAVERVVLLAPAVSPRYDLTAALRAVRREMVVFWSPFDLLVLGAGTRIFGTIDRVRTIGAGLVGFRVAPVNAANAVTSREYGKLRQVRWHPRMAASGNLGGHMGPDSPFFLRKYVVPLLGIEETPDR